MGFVARPFALLWRHRLLLLQTTRNDIRARYAGSVLGLAWLVLYPLLFLGVYSLVCVYVLKPRIGLSGEISDLVLSIFCGLIPFIGFAEGLSTGIVSVTSNANLIKNTLLPIELIPVKTVLTSQCTQVAGTGLLLLSLGFFGKLTPFAALLPIVWILQVLFTLGLVWILSSLNVYLRDLQNIIGVVILMLMIASPIAISVEQMSPKVRMVMGFNPLYYVISAYRECLLGGRFPRRNVFWILLGIAVVSFFAGHWFFVRMKKVFADNV